MRKPSRALLAAALCGLLLTLTGCATGTASTTQPASTSPAPSGYLVYMTHVVLHPRHPAHVTFHLATSDVRVIVAVEQPLLSYALEQVTPLPPSHPVDDGVVALAGASHTEGGQTTYGLRNAKPLVAGWYRLELVGRGEVIGLTIEGR
jgi:hypothetical protein